MNEGKGKRRRGDKRGLNNKGYEEEREVRGGEGEGG